MSKTQMAIQEGLMMEAIEMVGKATTLNASEMETEKKEKLGNAIDHAINGGTREKTAATLDGIRQGFGLSIVNGVERAHEALETVRHDAMESKAYAIAKGVVNVPAQIMRGMVVDTTMDVAQIAGSKIASALPDLPTHTKEIRSKEIHDRPPSRER